MTQQEKEWLLLSGMLKSYPNYVVGSTLVNPKYLTSTTAIILSAIKRVYESGNKSIERESLIYDMDTRGELKIIGGTITIDSISNIDFSLDQEGFSRLCNDLTAEGESQHVKTMLKTLAEENCGAKELVAKTIDELYRISDLNKDRFGIIRADEASRKITTRTPFAKTYITSLDTILGGLYMGDYHIIAARPSMGKSALGLQIGYESALDGSGVLFISLEMSQEMLTHRMKNYIGGQSDLLDDIPLYYKCDSNITFPEIAATVQMARMMYDIKIVVIDYIGLVKGQARDQTTNSFITYISNGLQNMARSMGICVIALAQLNRNSEIQERPPAIHDLRDSGSLEQDADVITLIYRPSRTTAGKLIVVKHRHGDIGELKINFDRSTLKFEDCL